MDEILRRVGRMEKACSNMLAANESLKRALEEWCEVRDHFQEVQTYYYSDQWSADVDLSNQGILPSDLPQGTLSEDYIYDVMGSNHFLALDLIDAAMHKELKRDDE